jgi:hypothetical protein
MARPVEKEDWQIIAAGEAIEREAGGKPVRPTVIRDRIGGGNTARIRQVWDDHLADRAQEAARADDPDSVLPPALHEFYLADQEAQQQASSRRFMTIYRTIEKEIAARFAPERSALMTELETARAALRESDDLNDRLTEQLRAVEHRVQHAQADGAEQQRRADRLEGQLAAADQVIAMANEAAAQARADQVAARTEFAAMTERAIQAEAELKARASHGKPSGVPPQR